MVTFLASSSGPDCWTIFLIVMVATVWAFIRTINMAAKAAAPVAKVAAKTGFWWWLNH